MDLDKLQQQYIVLIKKFFAGQREEALFEVAEIGKELMKNKIGPDVLLELHSNGLKRSIEGMDPLTLSKNLIYANDLLLNAIMAYAMNYYSILSLLENEKKKLAQTNKEMQELNQNLIQMNEKLEELDHLKSLFIASMSHELRTPLNSIIGFSGILLMGLAGELNSEQRKQIAMIKNSGNHLLDLINDILDISKIETGKLELDFSPVNLETLCTELIGSMTPQANQKKLKLIYQAHQTLNLYTDGHRLRQIIMNLLSNAIKYTEKGRVTLNLSQENDGVFISVADTGVGISPDKMSDLFKPFTRLGAEKNTTVSGTGLGLYLSQKLAFLLGGRISVITKPDRGSTFTLELPLKGKQDG